MKMGKCSVCGKEITVMENSEEHDKCEGADCTDGKTYCKECYQKEVRRSAKRRFESVLHPAMKKIKKTYCCPLNSFNRCSFQCDTKKEMEAHIREEHFHNITELEFFGRDN
jgi:hypothetical protein